MAKQTLNNGELASSFRNKINSMFTEVYNLFTTKLDNLESVNYVATENIDTGNITSATMFSLTSTGKVWGINSLVDKVVRINRSTTDFEFVVVSSNTTDTITFDDTSLIMPSGTFIIMPTVVLTNVETVVSINADANSCAVLLPLVVSGIERKKVSVYIENAPSTGISCPVMCRGTNRQAGVKYGTLDNRRESVKLYAHTMVYDHWDILNTVGVKRYFTSYLLNPKLINVGAYTILPNAGDSLVTNARRFLPVTIGGMGWFRYTSLIKSLFLVNVNFVIEKSGANVVSVIDFAVRKTDFSTGITTDLTNIVSRASLVGNGLATISLNVTVELGYNDVITLIGKTDGGTITLIPGSSLVISEL